MSLKSFSTNKLWWGGIFLLSLFFSSAVHAEEIQVLGQLNFDDSFLYTRGDSNIIEFVPLFSGILTEAGTIQSAPGGAGTLTSGQFCFDDNAAFSSASCTTIEVPTDNVDIDLENGDVPALWRERWDTVSSTRTVVAGVTYYLTITTGGTAGGSHALRYYGTNFPEAGDPLWSPTSTVQFPDSPFLYLNAEVGDLPSFTDLIAMPTTTCDFASWQTTSHVDDAVKATYTGGGSLAVVYGTVPTVYAYQDTITFIPDGRGLVPKNTTLPAGSYVARSYLCNSNVEEDCDFTFGQNSGNIVAESIEYTFTVGETCTEQVLYPGSTTPSATSTNGGDNLTCDQASNFFTSGMCQLFEYLFSPSPQAVSRFGDLKDELAAKPPFGYISVYQEQIGNLSTASSTTSSAFTGISSANSLHLSTWATLEIFDTIRTVFAWFFWLVFVFYIYRRFREFSLHG